MVTSSASRRLPEPDVLVTGYKHDAEESIILPRSSLDWVDLDNHQMSTSVGYINKLYADPNDNKDLEYSEDHKAKDTGLVSKGGAALRYIDFAPGYTCMMHRTKSIDYGIVLEGHPECVMDSGETRQMKTGDCMVQRYTKHAWRNPSTSEWARVLFVLMDCEPLTHDGQTLKEDLGTGAAFVPASGND